MRTWSKTAGLFFTAAVSVYSFQAIAAAADRAVSQANGGRALPTDVKLLSEESDPFASSATTRPVGAAASTESAASLASTAVNVNAAGTG